MITQACNISCKTSLIKEFLEGHKRGGEESTCGSDWSRRIATQKESIDKFGMRHVSDWTECLQVCLPVDIFHAFVLAVVVNRSDALKNADVLAAIEAELGTKLSPFVLFVGRLRPIKDPAYILQPFIEFLKKSKHRIQLLFVGSINCQNHSRFFKLRCESVHWIESIPQPQVHALMTAAVCLVNSSLSEGQPLSVMEAMALGCPVVARSIPGNLDLIDHEKTGLIFDSQNGFKDCLQRLLTDEALRVAISTRAMEKMKRPEFQLHNEAAAYLDLLRELQTRQTHW
ncbi:unnamed protein product [Mesocestoides corti]|uniref:Glycosyl transferase family 1 domain-containing protein n=1 Tax=Mesocestoides corti TaxID=53468 RepID=A0A0R3U414_MESCO|nr:unnamed protein product [Mesocestoides corti]